MADLDDGASVEVQGSGSNRYTLKNVGGVYSCSCPAWRNAGGPQDRRTCKHLKAYRGEEIELARVGGPPPARARASSSAAAKKDAPPLLLAHAWELSTDPTGWWMSEKLDGVRAYWDGKQMWSRLGNAFHVPEWFLDALPNFPLDGELFGGRKKLQQTVGLVKRQDKSDHWKELRYVVFDAPAHEAPFEARLELVVSHMKKKSPPYAQAHEHERCGGIEHLKKELARVEALGGEGLMLRRPGSKYEVGRSSTLLKVKTFFDAEAKVVGYEDGRGKHKGRVGSLLVEMPDGTRFSVGTGLSDKERDRPPPVGAVITFRYQELSNAGVPRFPSYVGMRADAAWPPVDAAPAPKGKPAAAVIRARDDDDDVKEPASAPTASIGVRRFEFVEGTSSKFWEISTSGASHTVRFGRIGTNGQSKTKTFASPEAARRDAETLIAEKTGKGYVERVAAGAAEGGSPERALDAQEATTALPPSDTVFFSGDDDAISEHCDSDNAVIVDWREEDTAIVDYVAEKIPEAELSHKSIGDDTDIELSYKGRATRVGLTLSPRDRYITIRALNRALAPDYELRLLTLSRGSDTHVFLVRSAEWWREAERAHAEETRRVFARVTESMDFE